MPTIDELQYGYDAAGIKDYLDKIQAEALKGAEDAVKDISSIETCCKDNWEGQSRDVFLKNLQEDANFVAQQFDDLYKVLVDEINAVQAAMANGDSELFNQ